ncbi:hypothetical protein D9V32_03730 [Mycetocola tolaasinivorans]|uniref:Uncharacterized protein n=1 Tax=Mycetocola tolaasinivorans TaxID=76635 RepID=A0A3L7A9K3_9MICO|nr:hypothetical protein D9V32_03730 [Mycetocola tolaasinivorans]
MVPAAPSATQAASPYTNTSTNNTAPLDAGAIRALLEAERSGVTLTRRQLRDLERARGTGTAADARAAESGRVTERVVPRAEPPRAATAPIPAPPVRDRAAEAEASAAAVRAEVERVAAEKAARESAARREREAAEAARVAEAARLASEQESGRSKRAKKKASRKDEAEKAAAEAAAEAESRRVAEERARAAERAAEERAAQARPVSDATLSTLGITPAAPALDETIAMPRLGEGFGLAPAAQHNTGAFDDIIARGVDTTGGSSPTTNALILPSVPGSGPLSGPVLGSGEVIVTGTIDLPGSLSNTGQNRFEKGDLDTMFDHDEDPQPVTAGNPVSASRAVSSHAATRDVIAPPAPAKNNRLLMVLSITAGVLAVALVAVVIVAIVSGSI